MPVNTPNKLYNAKVSQWMRCRDAHDGSDAIKARMTLYLPMLEGQSAIGVMNIGLGIDPVNPVTGQLIDAPLKTTGYAGYITRAMFYPATSRTVLGLIGLMFGKPPTPPEVDDKNLKQFNDVTLSGQSLTGFAVEMAREILITGRVGVLVDYAEKPATPEFDRPYWLLYATEDIINWQMSRIGGRMMLTRVVLRERINEDVDEFETEEQIRYRVLRLTNSPGGLTYSVQLYTANPEKPDEYIAGPVVIPLRRGAALDFIPFQFCGPTTLTAEPEHPPLVDLVDVNISHYRTSADREHGAHFTALPTPWVKGHQIPQGESLGVGSGTAWVLPNENASAGMLEFSGAGLESLKDIMEEKRLLMATLGARMLETQKNVQEAAQTQAMRHAGEGSALGIMSDTLSKALTNICGWHLYWNGADTPTLDEKKGVTLNPELLEQLTHDDITALTALWQAGGISKKTLYYNLQWGEWTRPDVDFETEQEDIDEEEAMNEPDPSLVPPQLDAQGNPIPPQPPNNNLPPQAGA